MKNLPDTRLPLHVQEAPETPWRESKRQITLHQISEQIRIIQEQLNYVEVELNPNSSPFHFQLCDELKKIIGELKAKRRTAEKRQTLNPTWVDRAVLTVYYWSVKDRFKGI